MFPIQLAPTWWRERKSLHTLENETLQECLEQSPGCTSHNPALPSEAPCDKPAAAIIRDEERRRKERPCIPLTSEDDKGFNLGFTIHPCGYWLARTLLVPYLDLSNSFQISAASFKILICPVSLLSHTQSRQSLPHPPLSHKSHVCL